MATIHEKGFTVLYEGPNPKIDVVFVHGFTGHPKDTWTYKKAREQPTKGSKKHGRDDGHIDTIRSKLPRLTFHRGHATSSTASSSTQSSSHMQSTEDTGAENMAESEWQRREVYWPKDLACMTIPDSRVLTYGYDTHIRHWLKGPVSRKTVFDHAGDLLYSFEALRRNPTEKDRSILFVAHSLGGIVVKEALRQSRGYASAKPHIYSIFDATVGFLFFGTPHRGADPRNSFHHLLAASAQAFGVKVNKQIVDTLMPHAEQLSKLRSEFSLMCHERKWTVFSFQEEYGVTGLFGKQVVDKDSSCLDDPTIETKQHISSNHMDMCRFSGLQDPEYFKVADAMKFILATTENGTRPMGYEQPIAGRQSHAVSLMAESDDTSGEPSVIRRPPADTSPATETKEEHLKFGCGIDAAIKESLIEQLYFTKIDERLTSLTAAQGTTCCWFLAKPEYAAWRDVAKQSDHGGFLWIKGNPGTGKSTLMKFLFEEAKRKTQGDSTRITLSFFFLARGTTEEKSTIGLYRSLLHQLFQKAEDLRDSLEWMTPDGARGIDQSGWHEVALKQTMMHAVPKLGSRELTIFVDALDECDQRQAAGMVSFFEDLCDRADEAQVTLHICFSSRHYPTIVIQKGMEVTLEDESGHIDDIQQYIKSKLRLGKTKRAEALRTEILQKSSGIFLWVVLVLDILNAEYPNSSVSIKEIRNRLEEIPPGLHELFEKIIGRDEKNLEQLQMCLKWILFAARPLQPQELYFAIQLGLDRESSGCWDPDDIELDEMKTFVRSSSKGLAEVTRNKTCEVQFIHESVRDFLLGRYGATWSEAGNFEGHCHEILRDCCLAQLDASINLEVEISDTLPPTAELRESLKLKFPFLEYSVLNVLHHANCAQKHGLEQKRFLANFPLPRWVLFNNAYERYPIRRYKQSVSLLYIIAERNLGDLIRLHPRATYCFDVENERYGPPFFAALATDGEEAIKSFVDVLSDTQPPGPFRDLCKQFLVSRKKYVWIGRTYTFPRKKSLRLVITEQDDEELLAFFIAAGQTNGGINREREGLLSHAVARGFLTVVCMLLATVEFDDKLDKYLQTPLARAASNGRDAVVRLLVDNGAGIELKDIYGRTPLSNAALHGHDTIVRILLEAGADIESKDIYGLTLLSNAIAHGHNTIVRLLLEAGADIESKDSYGRTPLSKAAIKGCDTVVRILIEAGADIESKDNSGQTPLSDAATFGRDTIARTLLEAGADINSKESAGQTPLLYAIYSGHASTVQLLLDTGRADVNVKDAKGRTPVGLAAHKGQGGFVQLLLDNGAKLDPNDADRHEYSAYETAFREYQMQLMLLQEQNRSRQARALAEQERPDVDALLTTSAQEPIMVDRGSDVESMDSSG